MILKFKLLVYRIIYRIRKKTKIGINKEFSVNILTESKGWILYHWAELLKESIHYITINAPEGISTIDYAIPHYFKKNFNTTNYSIGYFAHEEKGNDAASISERELFNKDIKRFDVSVVQNITMKKELIKRGAKDVRLIIPSIPHELFRPKLRLGFIGRKYKNNRKNFHWLERLDKLDWIEMCYKQDPCHWSAVGHKAAQELAKFYRSLDYVLVTSKSEGGPMCVIEGLSCGIPVIIPEGVGQYKDFEKGIITYDPNYKSLVELLEKLFIKKKQLHKESMKYTIDKWCSIHKELFDSFKNKV